MAVIPVSKGVQAGGDFVSATPISLGVAQTGNVDTTNTAFVGNRTASSAVVLTSTVGATPTVTVNIQGSADGTNFYNARYSVVATPATFGIASFAVTTATTTTYILEPNTPWQYLKLVYSANTNVTLTATLYL